jgi:5-formyltetrahydrofolate cyclo-ligase
MESKGSLRLWASRRRAASPPLSFDDLLAHEVAAAARVAAYQGILTEPRVTVQVGWLLPVVTAGLDLDWAEHTGSTTTRRGLEEPDGPLLGREAIAGCDLVLVPALLVDRRGYRLGKGGGCYDRALARTTAFTIALVNDDELVDELPAEPHDVRVDAVATPSRGVVRLIGKM